STTTSLSLFVEESLTARWSQFLNSWRVSRLGLDAIFAQLILAFLKTVTRDFAAAKPVFEQIRHDFETRWQNGDTSLSLSDTVLEIVAALGDRTTVVVLPF